MLVVVLFLTTTLGFPSSTLATASCSTFLVHACFLSETVQSGFQPGPGLRSCVRACQRRNAFSEEETVKFMEIESEACAPVSRRRPLLAGHVSISTRLRHRVTHKKKPGPKSCEKAFLRSALNPGRAHTAARSFSLAQLSRQAPGGGVRVPRGQGDPCGAGQRSPGGAGVRLALAFGVLAEGEKWEALISTEYFFC